VAAQIARAGVGRRVVAREWAREPRDRVGEEIRRSLGVRGGKGAALPSRNSEERRRQRRGTEKQRSRGRVEDNWTDLQFSDVPGTCL
jgi:hypothetical protein